MKLVLKKDLKELMRITLTNILNTKGVIYLHYKKKQQKKWRQLQYE
jgi:hypothetical protein